MTKRLRAMNLVDFIYLYAAQDIILSSVLRIFLLYCTWYLIKISHSSSQLSLVLIVAWLANMSALLISNIISQKYGYSKTIKVIAVAVFLTMILYLCVYYFTNISSDNISFVIFLAVISVVLSSAAAMMKPLSNPLIMLASNNKNIISIRITILSKLFIFNLIIGTFIGGTIIKFYGGEVAIEFDIILSALGVIISLLFNKTYQHIESSIVSKKENVINQLREAAKYVVTTPPEKVIAIISMLMNMVITPVIFLIFPVVILNSGNSIIDVSLCEIFVGVGVLTSSYILKIISACLSSHNIVSLSILLCSISIVIVIYIKSILFLFLSSFILGIGLACFNIVSNTKRTLSIPMRNLPNMEGFLLFLCTASIPFGFFVSNYFIKRNHINFLLLIFLAIIIVSALVSYLSKSFKLMLNDAHIEDVKYYERVYSDIYGGNER